MVKPSGFSHVAVKITDVDKSRNFYEKVIGLKKIHGPRSIFRANGTASATTRCI